MTRSLADFVPTKRQPFSGVFLNKLGGSLFWVVLTRPEASAPGATPLVA
jgi:hypothetical protein